jgi:hypothetical protein
MYDKKQSNNVTPDLKKLKEVVIDARTKIYIDPDADAEEAKKRYLERVGYRKLK